MTQMCLCCGAGAGIAAGIEVGAGVLVASIASSEGGVGGRWATASVDMLVEWSKYWRSVLWLYRRDRGRVETNIVWERREC